MLTPRLTPMTGVLKRTSLQFGIHLCCPGFGARGSFGSFGTVEAGNSSKAEEVMGKVSDFEIIEALNFALGAVLNEIFLNAQINKISEKITDKNIRRNGTFSTAGLKPPENITVIQPAAMGEENKSTQ